MLFILSFIFSGVLAIVATRIVRDKPKTCYAAIVLMSVLIYYLY